MFLPSCANAIKGGDFDSVCSHNVLPVLLVLRPNQFFRAIFLSGVILLPVSVTAQSTAAIGGQVTDAQSAVVPGAAITVRSSEINIIRKTFTDDAGRYQIAALPIGAYSIEVKAQGFKTQVVAKL